MQLTMRTSLGAGALALTLILAAGCSSGETSPTAPNKSGAPSSSAPAPEPEPAKTTDAAPNVEGVSPERANLAKALEITYSARNARAEWTDGSLHITLDPDGDSELSLTQFMDCRVFTQMVDKTESVEVQYGDKKVLCTDVLAQD